MTSQYFNQNINDYFRVDVAQFGAVGDGVTDVTAAIQQALNFVASKSGSVVFSPGTYLISDTLILPSGVSMVGQSRGGTVLLGNQLSKAFIRGEFTDYQASSALRQFDGRIAHITLNNTSRNAAGGVGIDLRQWTRSTVYNCRIINFETGIRLENVAFYNEIRNTEIATCGTGMTLKNGANSNSIYGGRFAACSVIGIDIDTGPDASTNDFCTFGTSFEGNGTAVRVNGTQALPAGSIYFYGPRLEGNAKNLEFVPDPDDVLAVRSIGFYNTHASSGSVMAVNDEGNRADWDKQGFSTGKQTQLNGWRTSSYFRITSGAGTLTPTIVPTPFPATQGSIIEAWVVGIDSADPANMYERRHKIYAHGATPTIDANSVEVFPVNVADARIGAIGNVDSQIIVDGSGDLVVELTGVAGKDVKWWVTARWIICDSA